MKFRPSLRSLVFLQGLGYLVAVCGSGDPSAAEAEAEAEVGEVEQSIAKERFNGEAEVWGRRVGADPARDRALMATGAYITSSGMQCSATMIGPHIAMTAGHCGGPTGKMSFFIYDSPTNRAQVRTEQFDCTIILSTFPETDLALAFCDSNIFAEAPGDKYGYLDFELWHPPGENVNYINSRNLNLAVDQKRYSGWVNPVVSLSNTRHLIYSEGFVGETDAGLVDWVDKKDAKSAELIDQENTDRKELYKLIAEKEKTTEEKVAERNAARNFQRAQSGEYLKDKDGAWKRKK